MSEKIKYFEARSFEKNFKQLKKRFKTLNDDMAVAKRNAIELYHLHKIDNNSIFQVTGFDHTLYEIYKLRKFACKRLKGKGAKSGIRIIYAFQPENIEVTFLEMYFKADRLNENRRLIVDFLNTH